MIIITGASLIRSTSLPLFAHSFFIGSQVILSRELHFSGSEARARFLCVLQHLRLGCPPVAYWWGRCFTSIISREFEQFPPWRDKDFIKMAAGGNVLWQIIWFLILIFIAFPVAGFCAGWYILILPFTVCIDGLTVSINTSVKICWVQRKRFWLLQNCVCERS